jgi:hypothetical protein
MEEWSLAPREFPIRINARQLLDTLWRELAAAVAE